MEREFAIGSYCCSLPLGTIMLEELDEDTLKRTRKRKGYFDMMKRARGHDGDRLYRSRLKEEPPEPEKKRPVRDWLRKLMEKYLK